MLAVATNVLSAVSAFIAAALWWKASREKVKRRPLEDLVPGFNVNGVDLVATAQAQSKWNSMAATAAMFSAVFLGIGTVAPYRTRLQSGATTSRNVSAPVSSTIYPHYETTVPVAFRGGWDEMVGDQCAQREARYSFTATTASNFEVRWDVTRIKMLSPTEVDLNVSTNGDNGQVDDVWKLDLADNGQTLRFRKPDTFLYRKCMIS